MKSSEAKEMLKFEKVEYIPSNEIGYVSSVNDRFIHVKFENQLLNKGWEGTTSQACDHEDVKDLRSKYHGWITTPTGIPTGGKSFGEAMKNAAQMPVEETEARMNYVAERMEIMKKNMRR